jgi:hypothetical protein
LTNPVTDRYGRPVGPGESTHFIGLQKEGLMRRRRSRRYRWLPAALTAGGLALILLGGVAASPGGAPDNASTAEVGLVADNASATVVPNADFLKTRARALEMLEDAVQRLRSAGTTSASAAADRLEAVGDRLARVTPSQPEELEAIIADLNREVARGFIGRSSGIARPSAIAPGAQPQLSPGEDRLSLLREVLAILRDIVEVLRQLIESLFPPPPYAPHPYNHSPHG